MCRIDVLQSVSRKLACKPVRRSTYLYLLRIMYVFRMSHHPFELMTFACVGLYSVVLLDLLRYSPGWGWGRGFRNGKSTSWAEPRHNMTQLSIKCPSKPGGFKLIFTYFDMFGALDDAGTTAIFHSVGDFGEDGQRTAIEIGPVGQSLGKRRMERWLGRLQHLQQRPCFGQVGREPRALQAHWSCSTWWRFILDVIWGDIFLLVLVCCFFSHCWLPYRKQPVPVFDTVYSSELNVVHWLETFMEIEELGWLANGQWWFTSYFMLLCVYIYVCVCKPF